ncbi:hypothetical protein FS749_011955 [Ceratobasidium sp. UAMH 11750]|nr:hypothetical protein FS749_011955 [Ceratobasidium sp. UAMH 11750]
MITQEDLRMASQDTLWGPGIDQYSINFEPRRGLPFWQEHDFYNQTYQITAPIAIEDSLRNCDPRVDGSNIDLIRFDYMVGTLQRYMDAMGYSVNVFKHRLGFVCVRRIVHTACLLVLRETNSMGELRRTLSPGTSWSGMSRAAASIAIDRVAEATTDAASLEDLCKIFTRPCFFVDWGDAIFTAKFIAALLWSDRECFLLLCQRGLLPGCALLLFIALKVLSSDANVENEHKYTYLELQDLTWRLYLVGSSRDRQILQSTYESIVKVDRPCNKVPCFASSEDTRRLSQSFSRLLVSWQKNNPSINTVQLDLATDLARFVNRLTVDNPLTTFKERGTLAPTYFQFLWLLFEQKGQIPTADHYKIRYAAAGLFEFLKTTQSEYISSQDDQYKLAQILVDADAISFAGRVLLLMLGEGQEFQATLCFDLVLNQLYEMKGALDKSVSVAPTMFHDSGIEWRKVVYRLQLFKGIMAKDTRQSHPEAARFISDFYGIWLLCGASLVELPHSSWPCSYPRCFQPRPHLLEFQYACGRCKGAVYCSSTCQHAHWKMTTSESHQLECVACDETTPEVDA